MDDNPASDAFHHRLIQKLEVIAVLTADEKQALGELPYVARDYPADEDVFAIGDRPTECCVLVEGWACRYKMLQDGQRQIMSFQIPGDMPDLQSLLLRRMDHSMSGLTPIKVAFIHHRDMREIVQRYEGIAMALWRDSLVEAAIFREWLVGVGRRTAHERIAHLFCEMATKARAVGLNEGDVYPWPVTQVEVSDALGLSDVHVNRVFRDLRLDGLVEIRRRAFTVLDWNGLMAQGQFDPHYLHIDQDAD